MKHYLLMISLFAALVLSGTARADDLAGKVDLSPLRPIAVQQDQTMKTLDTFARQVITTVTGHGTLDGHEPVYTLLDMSFRPELYVDRNIIKISNIPLREEFQGLDWVDPQEAQRILKQGTVSLRFLEKPEVGELFDKIQAASVQKTKAINEVRVAGGAMHEVCELNQATIPAAIFAPIAPGDTNWYLESDVIGASPGFAAFAKSQGRSVPKAPDGYEAHAEQLDQIVNTLGGLRGAWVAEDAATVNKAAVSLGRLLPELNPGVYPSHAKRVTEVMYNRLMKLTFPGAAFYFIAFVLFVLSAFSGVTRLRLWGLRFMVVGFAVHTTGIAIRWWLVGDIFPPIKNEFESVMFSAWFGALLGLILELRKSRGLFGAAASFVGTLALVAIDVAPYVTGKQIGGEINQVQGILMSYWLYIHVTMVTASYSLIAMAFVLSSWWLWRYYKTYGTLRPGAMKPGKVRDAEIVGGGGGGISGGAVALNFWQMLAMTFFVKRAESRKAKGAAVANEARKNEAGDFLATLDACNLVVLQLAFWMLGAGVMLGAVWADQSWGRPWGWDPKETFALVTWMVYLIAVHVRFVTANKAWWTAMLGFGGFFVMLFNWVGVNFFLVGLHSYA